MRKTELEKLQDPEAWDFTDASEAPKLQRKARAIVSVAFPADDFAQVERYAQEHGLKISELVRSATLQRVAGPRPAGVVGMISAGGAAQMTAYFQNLTTATASVSIIDADLDEPSYPPVDAA